MAPLPRILIARDRGWTGPPVDVAALGRMLERPGVAEVLKIGPDRLVAEPIQAFAPR